MSDEPDGIPIDFRSGLEVGHGTFRIGGKICTGGRTKVSRGGSKTPVIIAQYRNSVPGQMIGKHQKGSVPHQFLIPVLGTTARNQNNCWKPTFTLWHR